MIIPSLVLAHTAMNFALLYMTPVDPVFRAFGGLLGILIMLLALAFGVAFYFLPSIVALKTNHPSLIGIFLVNLFFGWSGIGWIACLIWSLIKPQPIIIQQSYYGQQPIPPVPAAMKSCPHCQAVSPLSSSFCSSCGQPI